MDLLFIIILGVLGGKIAQIDIEKSLFDDKNCCPYKATKLLSSILIFVISVGWLLIYHYNGLSIRFLLYTGFFYVFFIITVTDYLEEMVEDRTVLIGAVFTFALQIYLGKMIFAIVGAIAGAMISGLFYILGKYYNKSDIKNIKIVSKKEINFRNFKLPLVPCFALAIVINCLIPEGLSYLLLKLILQMQSNFVIQIISGILGASLLYYVHNKRSSIEIEEIENEKNMDEKNYGFGDGDVTISILMGLFLGWQEMLVIFWFGLVIHSSFGICLFYYKKKVAKKAVITV